MGSPTDSSAISTIFAFNGDADGIISQHLLFLAGIAPQRRLTGLKRDLRLLRHVATPGPDDPPIRVYVCDINLGDNRDDLLRLLQNSTTLAPTDPTIIWYDHHEPGLIPDSPRLQTRIATGRGACTGLLVHADLLAKGNGQDPRWAAIAAYGDNLPEAAEALLAPHDVPGNEKAALREAGELLNYNAYGETPDDVLFAPLAVATRMADFRDPMAFIRESGLIEPLRAQFQDDEKNIGGALSTSGPGAAAATGTAAAALYTLPREPWARRLGSTFANRAALEHPARAIAVLHPLEDGSYQVSIRAPRGRPDAPAAAALAAEFPSGGGRALAAGINRLPADQVDVFARRFMATYGT